MTNHLPKCDRPPLDEMAMGVQFDPLPKFHAVHLGLFWSHLREEYPHAEDQWPLSPATEPLDIKPSPAPAVTAVTVTVPPLPRCWFLTNDKTQLIQVQRDRFLRNWRQLQGDERYPRYGHLAQEFKRTWERFQEFIAEQELGPVNVNQCELHYINNIERAAGWSELGELDGIFPLLSNRKPGGFLPAPETLAWQARYKLPDGRGRLHVEMNPIFRARDMQLVLALNMTARGAPAAGSIEKITAWFDLAHEWAVKAFAELTDPRAHEFWGMKS
jgi:uncharacterized protein (TIGR04255 family)